MEIFNPGYLPKGILSLSQTKETISSQNLKSAGVYILHTFTEYYP